MSKIKNNIDKKQDFKERISFEELEDLRFENELNDISKEKYIELVTLNYKDYENSDVEKLSSEFAYQHFQGLSNEEKNKFFPIKDSDFSSDMDFFNSIKEEAYGLNKELILEEKDTNLIDVVLKEDIDLNEFTMN